MLAILAAVALGVALAIGGNNGGRGLPKQADDRVPTVVGLEVFNLWDERRVLSDREQGEQGVGVPLDYEAPREATRLIFPGIASDGTESVTATAVGTTVEHAFLHAVHVGDMPPMVTVRAEFTTGGMS